jgi:hypothetical protein
MAIKELEQYKALEQRATWTNLPQPYKKEGGNIEM